MPKANDQIGLGLGKLLGFGGPLLVYLVYRLSTTSADPDLWGYMAFGRLFWQGGGFPFQDVFSYAPVKPVWVYHEWLTGVVLYPIYTTLGGLGLQLLKLALGLAMAGLVFATACKNRASAAAAGIALFIAGGVFSLGYSPVRAGVFTLVLFALSLLIMETARQEGRWKLLIWLLPIQILWANLHGGFVSGLGLIGLYALGEALARRRFGPYVWALAGAAAATLINPYGLDYWTYLVKALT
ncbi:MAG: hypothetical protein PVG03_12090, partial [Desulfarculaceae bacterium]